jgi:hypothetical protein
MGPAGAMDAREVAECLRSQQFGGSEVKLGETFDYSYAQIAEMLQLTEAHARQLASRARKFLGGERRQAVSAEEHRRLLDAFLAAARGRDRAGRNSF